MFKRVGLFLLTNLLVMATISIVMSVLGVGHYLTAKGINYQSLMVFAALWGMGGAFISLAMSRFMAKRFMGVQVIDPKTASAQQKTLVDTIHRLARKANLPKMPEVGIYDSPEPNAFATGPSKRSSLVAVSTGLLNAMSADEVEGVLGHEISHVANGDMVTMTLIQGVINAFAIFLSRIVAYAVSTWMSSDEEGGGISYLTFYLLSFVFDILFTILGSTVTAAFSRWREFHADAGGARLAGRDKMIAALERLKTATNPEQVDNRAPAMANLKINRPGGILALFASHPPLDKRIARLRRGGH